MARLTITLPDDRHQALKEAAARRGKTIRQLIDESLAHYGIKTEASAAALHPRRDAHRRVPVPALGGAACGVPRRAAAPAIQRRHGLQEAEIDRLLTAIVTNAIIRDPPPCSGAPDVHDAHLWALALEGAETVLVTGDAARIAAPPATVVVMSPRDFRGSALDCATTGTQRPANSPITPTTRRNSPAGAGAGTGARSKASANAP